MRLPQRFRPLASLLLLLTVVLAGGACGGDDGTQPTTGPGLALVATEFRFTPPSVRVTSGRQVTVQFRNDGAVVHNLSTPTIAAEFDVDVAPGQTVPVIFVPPADGSLEFFCKYHRDTGMTGAFLIGP